MVTIQGPDMEAIMETMRCFIAVDMPNHIKKMLNNLQKKLRSWPARVKWVEEQNFHLTLKFLGDLPVDKIQPVQSVLSDVCSLHKQLEINLKDVGAFPNVYDPRVIWVGILDLNRSLLKLQSDLEIELEKLGFSREKRRFSPHLTLGRVKEFPAKGLSDEISHLEPVDFVIPVKEIKMMRSILSPKGPEYSCINTFYLQEH